MSIRPKLIPVAPNSKRPLLKDWPNQASDDPAVHEQWQTQFPGCNIGLVTGSASGVIVLDVDLKTGGRQSLETLQGRYGVLPMCPQVRTPSGGGHYYFQAPEFSIRNSVGALGPGLDIRGDAGFILIPPSSIDGRPYEQVVVCEAPPMPSWLLKLISEPRTNNPFGEGISEGGRNDALFRYAAYLIGKRDPNLVHKVTQRNDSYSPPLSADEVNAVLESARKRYERKHMSQSSLKVVDLATVKEAEVDWLVYPYIPTGELSILEGVGGLGKSTLSFNWAASSPGNVLLWAKEDQPSVIRARAEAAGCLSKVKLLQDSFTLPIDASSLESAILENEVTLVIIDPITSCFGELSPNDPQSVRRALEPLRDVAHRTRAGILLIRHWNKRTDLPFDYRGNGSPDILNLVRSVSALVKGPENETILCSLKNNYVALPKRPPRCIRWVESGEQSIIELGMPAPYTVEELEQYGRGQ